MALTRKFLSALGIEAEKLEEIISAHVETVDALKEERDKYKADAEKLPGVQQELDDLKQAGGNNGDAWKTKHDALKAEFDQYKADVEKEKTTTKKKDAYKALLKDSNVLDNSIDAILKVTNFDDINLDDSGNLKDSDKLKESIAKEWAGFISKSEQRGADTPKPLNNTGGSYKTKAEIMAIKDRTERRKAIAENPSLFGIE